MLSGNQEERNRAFSTRNYGAWILCALLVLFCVNAGLARYETHQRIPKLATTQAYLDGVETLRKVPQAADLVLWHTVTIANFVGTTVHGAVLAALLLRVPPFKGFDPETYLRPPPVQ